MPKRESLALGVFRNQNGFKNLLKWPELSFSRFAQPLVVRFVEFTGIIGLVINFWTVEPFLNSYDILILRTYETSRFKMFAPEYVLLFNIEAKNRIDC